MENNLPAKVPDPGQVGPRGIIPRNIEELTALATLIAKSGHKGSPAQLAGVIACGLELGLGPIAAAGCIHCIEGKFEVNYAGMCALMSEHWSAPPEFLYESEGDNMKCICRLRRKGMEGFFEGEYDVDTARRHGSWGRGYWKTNPTHMLRVRALTFAARLGFGNLLRGLYIEGEISEERGEPIPVEATVKAPVREVRQLPAEKFQEEPVAVAATAPAAAVEPAPPLDPAAEAGLTEEAFMASVEAQQVDEHARKVRIGKRLLEMAGGEKGPAESLLIKHTTLNGYIGFRTLKSPRATGQFLVDLDHRVKEAWEAWKKEQKA